MVVQKKIPKNAQPVDSCGETWWLSEVTPALRRVFASTVRARARQQLMDDKAFLSKEGYSEEKDSLQDRIDAGAYEWGPPIDLGGVGAGKAIRAALDADEGTLQLVQLLLAEAHGEVSPPRVIEIINGNPEGMQAALRAVQGLPPLAVAPAEEKPGTTEEKTVEKPEAAAVNAS